MSLSWLRVVIIGGALIVAAIVGVLSTGPADVWATLLALAGAGGLVAVAVIVLLAMKLTPAVARYVAPRRPTLRSLLAAGGGVLGVALVGLLAFNTYAILREEGSGSPSSGESDLAPSASPSPEAQETPACPPQQVYMPGLERCVPAPMSCAPSERWDFLRERCVPDIPEPIEPAEPRYNEPLQPAVPSYSEQRCQEARTDLMDALAELAGEQADLAQCQERRSRFETGLPCFIEESGVQSASREVESARSSVRIWCE
jgi:hypothetical protein